MISSRFDRLIATTLAFAGATLGAPVAWADPLGEASTRTLDTAKTSADAMVGAADSAVTKHKAAVDAGLKKAGFDGAGFQTAITKLHEVDPAKLKDATGAFSRTWLAATDKVISATVIDVKAEAAALAAKLGLPPLPGGRMTFGGTDKMQGAASAAAGGKGPTTTRATVSALKPTATSGLFAAALPGGVLHVHAITHDPLGKPAVSCSAGYSSEVTVPAGTTKLTVDVAIDVLLAIAFSAAGPGAATADARIEVRVLEQRMLDAKVSLPTVVLEKDAGAAARK